MNIHEWMGEELPTNVLNQTVEWIARLDALEGQGSSPGENLNKLDNATRAEFFEWLGADASHQQAFVDISEIWAKSACLTSFKRAVQNAHVIPFPTQPLQQKDFDVNQPLLADCPMQPVAHAPAWLYSVTLAIISIGAVVPFVFS